MGALPHAKRLADPTKLLNVEYGVKEKEKNLHLILFVAKHIVVFSSTILWARSWGISLRHLRQCFGAPNQ